MVASRSIIRAFSDEQALWSDPLQIFLLDYFSVSRDRKYRSQRGNVNLKNGKKLVGF